MGFINALINVATAGVKVGLSPVAAVVDVAAKVLTGENPELTTGAIQSAGKDLEEALDEIMP